MNIPLFCPSHSGTVYPDEKNEEGEEKRSVKKKVEWQTNGGGGDGSWRAKVRCSRQIKGGAHMEIRLV